MPELLKRPTVSLLAVLAIVGRLLPHPPNFTPVGSAAMFGGAKIGRPWNYLLPVGIMLLTDIFLGFHRTMPYVYASFIAIVWLGEKFLSKKPSLGRVASFSLLGSLLFFFVTNFGVWIQGDMYALTTAGLIRCYVMALPFLKMTLAGDLIYSLGFFGLYALAENKQLVARFDNKLIAWLR